MSVISPSPGGLPEAANACERINLHPSFLHFSTVVTPDQLRWGRLACAGRATGHPPSLISLIGIGRELPIGAYVRSGKKGLAPTTNIALGQGWSGKGSC